MAMLNFSVSTEEANKILVALSNLPYGQVAELIQKLQIQIAPQVNPPVEQATE